MTYPFAKTMPVRPIHQKHSNNHHRDNNYGYLASLTLNGGADIDVRWVWRNNKKRTKTGGGTAFGFHGETPASNGYRWIMRKGHCHPMTDKELHRTLSSWTAGRVRDWRRGPSARSARPRDLGELYAYVKRHGGTIVAELKSRIFATHQWIVDQLVGLAKAHNHAPWFKALANMWGVAGKAARVAVAGGWFALIFGTHVKGRANRLRIGAPIVAEWPQAVQERTRIW